MSVSTGARTKAEMRAALEAFGRALDEHDVDAIRAELAADVVWESPSASRPVQGREAAVADLRTMYEAFPDVRYPEADFTVYTSDDPDTCFSTWTLTGTMTGPLAGMAATGKPVRIRGVCIYRFRDGLVAEHTMVMDGLELGQQIGLFPREEDFSYKAMAQLQRLGVRLKKVVRRR